MAIVYLLALLTPPKKLIGLKEKQIFSNKQEFLKVRRVDTGSRIFSSFLFCFYLICLYISFLFRFSIVKRNNKFKKKHTYINSPGYPLQ